MTTEKRLIAGALKRYHDAQFTPGVYEHSIFGKAALLLEADTAKVVHANWDPNGNINRNALLEAIGKKRDNGYG